MGGNIFPVTSRLDTASYTELQAHLETLLAPFFQHFTTPLPGPKATHGDIDFLAVSPPTANTGSLLAELTTAISATAALSKGTTLHFAVPVLGHDDATTRPQAQVDIILCPSLQALEWLAFRNAHSVGGTILGALVRRYGVILGGSGLEIEAGPHKGQRVMLCGDAHAVLEFYGLYPERWERRFDTREDLYAYLASSRFAVARERSRDQGETEEKGLKKGELWVGWWEFLHQQSFRQELEREAVQDLALDHFGKRVEYDAMVSKLQEEAKEELAASLVLAFIRERAESNNVPNLIVRALKRWGVMTDGTLTIRSEAEMRPDHQMKLRELLDGDQLSVDAQACLAVHWEELRTKEKGRVKSEKAARTEATATMAGKTVTEMTNTLQE